MSKSTVTKQLIAASCFAASVAYAQVPARLSSLQVNRMALAAAEFPEAERLAAALAMEKIPAGFVFAPNERRADPAPPRITEFGATVGLADVLTKFLATHPDYRTVQSEWAVVIQPSTHTACTNGLKRLLPDTTISDPAYVAFWKLARLVNPADTPTAIPSVVCGGNCNASAAPTYTLPVAVTLNRTSLQEALSQLVAQAPGLVWTVREERRSQDAAVPETVCRFGYFDGGLYVQTSYVFGKAPTHPGL